MTDPCTQEKTIDKIDRKMDYVASDISDLKVTQARIATVLEMQEKNLEEHMRRTVALEDRVDQFEKVMFAQKSFYKIMAIVIPSIISATAIIMKVFF